MIKHYLLTGDCHREFSRFNNLNTNSEETAIIVLGDFSVDYYLNNNDKKINYDSLNTLSIIPQITTESTKSTYINNNPKEKRR